MYMRSPPPFWKSEFQDETFTDLYIYPKLMDGLGKMMKRSNIIIFSPSQDSVAYPPKIYVPTLIRVTVGFL
jgi:hypothetical protein